MKGFIWSYSVLNVSSHTMYDFKRYLFCTIKKKHFYNTEADLVAVLRANKATWINTNMRRKYDYMDLRLYFNTMLLLYFKTPWSNQMLKADSSNMTIANYETSLTISYCKSQSLGFNNTYKRLSVKCNTATDERRLQ